MPEEFATWLSHAQGELDLEFILAEDKPTPNRLSRATLHAAMNAKWWRFYITDKKLNLPFQHPDINPNCWGLVTCDRPRFEHKTLIMAELSSKSDWVDDDDQVHENSHGHDLIKVLRKRIRKIASEAVWVRDIDAKDSDGHLVRAVRCTQRTAAWARDGGRMQQWGVPGTEFIVAK